MLLISKKPQLKKEKKNRNLLFLLFTCCLFWIRSSSLPEVSPYFTFKNTIPGRTKFLIILIQVIIVTKSQVFRCWMTWLFLIIIDYFTLNRCGHCFGKLVKNKSWTQKIRNPKIECFLLSVGKKRDPLFLHHLAATHILYQVSC
jgi:hypothetical protein